MGEHARVSWRFRTAASAASALACASLIALLVLVSRAVIAPERPAAGVEVFLAPPVEREAARPAAARGPVAAVSPPNPSAAPSVEAEMVQHLLRCFNLRGTERPPECAREQAPADWARPQILLGGRHATPEQPDLTRLYTRAEQQTLVMPSCVRDGASGACVRFGVTPPPPSRSAEQICRDGGLGGPCSPPPEN
jgi:hypothetical protein